jgi:hypothetical protein
MTKLTGSKIFLINLLYRREGAASMVDFFQEQFSSSPQVMHCFISTSRKRAFGLDPLVPASIWAGTKGPATSPQIRQPPGRL